MRFLFVHQNSPGQYLHIARRLAADPRHDVTFLSNPNANQISTVRKVEYKPICGSTPTIFKEAAEFETATIRARSIATTAATLAEVGYSPDIIFGHNGWGETLHLKDVWPRTPLVAYFEFFYHDRTIRLRNAVNLLGLEAADLGQTPTKFQHDTYPPWAREKIRIMPEGVDLDICQPDPAASFSLASTRRTWHRQVEPTNSAHRKLVTFVARNLEPYRGFHILMRALPRLLRERPDVDVILVGGDEVSYGAAPAEGGSWRKRLLEEVGHELAPGRVFFPGQLPYDDYVKLLKTSAVHVYLSYPFVASWSLREALACGCALVASDTEPVREFVTNDRNGLLVPFHDPVQLADSILNVLENGALRKRLADGARRYALRHLGLQRQFDHFDQLVSELVPSCDRLADRNGVD